MRKNFGKLLAIVLLAISPVILLAQPEAEGAAASATADTGSSQFSEAPMLAALVAAGELPPLMERIPSEPAVQEMLQDGVGTYGGVIRVSDQASKMNVRGHEFSNQEVDMYLLKMHQETREILPNLVKSYSVSADGLAIQLEIRAGTRWSNGDLFVPEDFMFVLEDMKWDPNVDAGWRHTEVPPTFVSVEKLDDHTVQFNLSQRDFAVIPGWTTWKGGNYVQYAPSTYLKKWHPRYNENAQKLAEEGGYATWAEALVANWNLITPPGLGNTPDMFPWIPKELSSQVEIWERNPYYFKVDPAGQQLPYIDQVISTPVADKEVFNIKAIAGEVDWAIAQTSFGALAEYKENEDRGNYNITLVPGVDVGTAYGFNPTYEDEKYRELFLDVRFRRAMSVALDRDELNDVYYFGLGRPTAATIHSDARFYKPEWQYLWATHDPELSNQLLDEVGLDGRDGDGFRTFPDGSNLTIQVAARSGGEEISKLFELEIGQWNDVGLRVVPNLVDAAAWTQNRDTDKFMLQPGVIDAITEFWNWINDGAGGGGVGLHGDFNMDGSYSIWENARVKVERGEQTLAEYGGSLPGTEPPDEWKEYFQWQRDFRLSEFGSQEWEDIAVKMYEFTGNGVFAIGTVGEAPAVLLSSKDLRNTPTEFPVSNTDWKGNLMYWLDQLWWDR